MPNAALDINQLDSTQPIWDLIQKHRPKPDEVDMDTQRKIAKGNAVAEAFRLLIDAVGGSRGANIQERKEPANAVMGAVDKYYKAKEANKAEQSSWDKLELGAGLEALKTKATQDYATQKQKEAQTFATSERVGGETARSAEAGLNRQAEQDKLKQQSEQFKQSLGLKSKSQAEDTAVKYAQIEAGKEKYRMMYPYGREKGMVISDIDINKEVRIPDDKKSQVLAYFQSDSNVQAQIPILRMRYGKVGTETETDYLIADLYGSLKPETRAQIRKFLNTSGAVAPQAAQPSSPLLSPLPYEPGKGPLMAPQTPTIKTDKKSTVVQVENAAQPQQTQATPEQQAYLQKIVQAKNKKYSPEVKRAAIYEYLVKQGYDPENAKSVSEQAYQVLTGN